MNFRHMQFYDSCITLTIHYCLLTWIVTVTCVLLKRHGNAFRVGIVFLCEQSRGTLVLLVIPLNYRQLITVTLCCND